NQHDRTRSDHLHGLRCRLSASQRSLSHVCDYVQHCQIMSDSKTVGSQWSVVSSQWLVVRSKNRSRQASNYQPRTTNYELPTTAYGIRNTKSSPQHALRPESAAF